MGPDGSGDREARPDGRAATPGAGGVDGPTASTADGPSPEAGASADGDGGGGGDGVAAGRLRLPDGAGALQVALAVALTVATLAPVGVALVGTGDPGAVDAVPRSSEPYSEFGAAVDPVDREVRVVAKLESDAVVPSRIRSSRVHTYAREDTRRVVGYVPLTELRALSNAPGVTAVRVGPDLDDLGAPGAGADLVGGVGPTAGVGPRAGGDGRHTGSGDGSAVPGGDGGTGPDAGARAGEATGSGAEDGADDPDRPRRLAAAAPRLAAAPAADDRRVATAAAAVGVRRVHRAGLTGEDVDVGVVGAGFRPSHPAVADQVRAYRSLAGDADGRHGTAVAAVVADVAPGADLHLAAVGATTTTAEYRAAVRWLRESGADVIVDAGSYFGGRSGADGVGSVASRAARDAVFVTSAGNYARRHWTGRPGATAAGTAAGTATGAGAGAPAASDWPTPGLGVPGPGPIGPPAEGWVRFGDDRHNGLGTGRIAGRVTLALRDPRGADYDLYLFRETPAGDVVVATGTERGRARERLSTVVPPGEYAVGIRHDAGGDRTAGPGPGTGARTAARDDVGAAGGTRPDGAGGPALELFASHRLERADPAGSLAPPAGAPGVLTVGAVEGVGPGDDRRRPSVTAFSSRGPGPAGGFGVDVVAPDDVRVAGVDAGEGTSFSAPYVAGVVALLLEARPGLSPAAARRAVLAGADDVGRPGADRAAGYGLVNATAALSAAAGDDARPGAGGPVPVAGRAGAADDAGPDVAPLAGPSPAPPD